MKEKVLEKEERREIIEAAKRAREVLLRIEKRQKENEPETTVTIVKQILAS